MDILFWHIFSGHIYFGIKQGFQPESSVFLFKYFELLTTLNAIHLVFLLLLTIALVPHTYLTFQSLYAAFRGITLE